MTPLPRSTPKNPIRTTIRLGAGKSEVEVKGGGEKVKVPITSSHQRRELGRVLKQMYRFKSSAPPKHDAAPVGTKERKRRPSAKALPPPENVPMDFEGRSPPAKKTPSRRRRAAPSPSTSSEA